MQKRGGHDAKGNKPVTKGYILSNSTYMRYLTIKFIENVTARVWGGGTGSHCFTAIEFQFCRIKRGLKMDGDDGCKTV